MARVSREVCGGTFGLGPHQLGRELLSEVGVGRLLLGVRRDGRLVVMMRRVVRERQQQRKARGMDVALRRGAWRHKLFMACKSERSKLQAGVAQGGTVPTGPLPSALSETGPPVR